MTNLVPAKEFDPSTLKNRSAEDCLRLTRLYLRRTGHNYFNACLCLQEAVAKLQKRKNNRLVYYKEIGLTKERAAEMLRVAEYIGNCKSANVRTYSQTALIELGNLRGTGKAIVDAKKNVSVAELRTLKKELPPEIKVIKNPAKIIAAVDTALNKKVSPKSNTSGSVTNKKTDIEKVMESLTSAYAELRTVRYILESKPKKLKLPKSSQIASMKTSIGRIREMLLAIEKKWIK